MKTAILLFCVLLPVFAQPAWRDQAILETARSPQARLHGVPVRAVTIGEGFWSHRRKVNVETSIPTLLELLEQHGIVDNFRRLSGRNQAPRRGPLYTDSDLYKWLEAVAFVLQSEDRPALKASAERIIGDILAAQEPTGYLNTYYVEERRDKRFTEMQRGHELYCLGHWLQAGIAWYRATGDSKLLDGGIRLVEYLIRESGPGKRPLLAGHPEIELALVELYRTTGKRAYLDFAGYILQGEAERLKLTPRDLTYMFSGKPFVSRTRMEGHSVRAGYAASGAADYYLETGDSAYWNTLKSLWSDMTARKMYLTGGIGSRASGEAFGEPYELPNQLAYTESCAAIANFFWNWRMLAATGDAAYTGVLERALYNGVNSGMSLAGNLYCYRNPLEMTGNPEDKIRNPWYDTTCCPPNLQRVLASLPGYMYSTSPRGVYVHLYHASRLDWRLEDGTALKLSQATNYPWDGEVQINVDPAAAREFSLFVRIPGWSGTAAVTVNGAPAGVQPKPETYLELRRAWKPGDRVTLRFDMAPRLTAANLKVRDNVGKVAVERGPLVYCMEGLDQAGGAVFDRMLVPGAFTTEFRKDLLGGVAVLKHPGVIVEPESDALYQPATAKRRIKPATLAFIPYYTFANREPTPMQVWIPLFQATSTSQ